MLTLDDRNQRNLFKETELFNKKLKILNKVKLDARLSVLNSLDAFGITDAQSNQFGTTSSFNAASSSVNFLLGRRWLGSLTATF